MAEYLFGCTEHGVFSVHRPMRDAGQPASCPTCHAPGERIYTATPDIWHCEGSHKGDYGTGNHTGTKADALNKQWSKYYKEPPPPPANDVPRNSSEKY